MTPDTSWATATYTAGWGPGPYRLKLPARCRPPTCKARNFCAGPDGDGYEICLFSDGVVEMSPGHFVAVFGFDNPASTSLQPSVNQLHRSNRILVANPQPLTAD